MMKRLISTSLFLAVCTASVNAEEIAYVAGDSSVLSSVCIAAVESMDAANQKARELGLSRYDMSELLCNGKPVSSFAKSVKAPEPAPLIASTGYIAVKPGDNTPVTELCIAAITSVEKFERLKQAEFGKVEDLESAIQCNGVPLENFMQKYNNKNLTAAL